MRYVDANKVQRNIGRDGSCPHGIVGSEKEQRARGLSVRFGLATRSGRHLSREIIMRLEELEQIAEDALNEACSFMQESIGIQTGDVAAQFFTGCHGDNVKRLFRQYLETELDWEGTKCRNGLPIGECKCC